MTPTQMMRLDALAAELGDRIRPDDRQFGACILSLLALHGAGFPLNEVADQLAVLTHQVALPVKPECYQ